MTALGDNVQNHQCPHCKSYRVRKNGKKPLASGANVQRWYCHDCGKTFQLAHNSLANRPPCPRCGGLLIYRCGLYSLADGTAVVRWFCRSCDKGFSLPLSNSSAVSCGLEEK